MVHQVLFGAFFAHQPLGFLAAEFPEEAGMNQEFAKGGSDQPAQNDGGHWIQNLAARLLGDIPVGVVTAVIGAPFFLLLLRRTRAGYEL